MKTPTAAHIEAAARIAASRERDDLGDFKHCDPEGAWHNYRQTNAFYNTFGPEEQAQAQREQPIAYKLFVHTYLTTQGWRR